MADGGWRMADGGWRMADGGQIVTDNGDAGKEPIADSSSPIALFAVVR
jgi:hypothetical protein